LNDDFITRRVTGFEFAVGDWWHWLSQSGFPQTVNPPKIKPDKKYGVAFEDNAAEVNWSSGQRERMIAKKGERREGKGILRYLRGVIEPLGTLPDGNTTHRSP